jgi:hypothetical protein
VGSQLLVCGSDLDLQIIEYSDVDQYLQLFVGGEDDREIGAG